MDMETLMVKQTTKTGQISKGSRILVAPGQVAVIYDSGAVLDATAEEGVYTFDESSSPSFFGGPLPGLVARHPEPNDRLDEPDGRQRALLW